MYNWKQEHTNIYFISRPKSFKIWNEFFTCSPKHKPQCSSSLLSPQSSSWSHLKASGMQDPEDTQRNWTAESQEVVAAEREKYMKHRTYTFRGFYMRCHSRHSCSSLMSPQSLSLSHFQMLLMHFPLAQRCWFGKQVCSERVNKSQEIHLNFITMFT